LGNEKEHVSNDVEPEVSQHAGATKNRICSILQLEKERDFQSLIPPYLGEEGQGTPQKSPV
jgi:hypothetical protein